MNSTGPDHPLFRDVKPLLLEGGDVIVEGIRSQGMAATITELHAAGGEVVIGFSFSRPTGEV